MRAYAYRLLLGIWIGALLCFGAVVAPALFELLTPTQSGAVVRRIVPALNGYGVGAALVLLALTQASRTGLARHWLRTATLGAMGLFAALSLWAVSPRLAQLRDQAQGRISDLPTNDPLRQRYGAWHAASTALAAGQLLLGLLALALPPSGREEGK